MGEVSSMSTSLLDDVKMPFSPPLLLKNALVRDAFSSRNLRYSLV